MLFTLIGIWIAVVYCAWAIGSAGRDAKPVQDPPKPHVPLDRDLAA